MDAASWMRAGSLEESETSPHSFSDMFSRSPRLLSLLLALSVPQWVGAQDGPVNGTVTNGTVTNGTVTNGTVSATSEEAPSEPASEETAPAGDEESVEAGEEAGDAGEASGVAEEAETGNSETSPPESSADSEESTEEEISEFQDAEEAQESESVAAWRAVSESVVHVRSGGHHALGFFLTENTVVTDARVVRNRGSVWIVRGEEEIDATVTRIDDGVAHLAVDTVGEPIQVGVAGPGDPLIWVSPDDERDVLVTEVSETEEGQCTSPAWIRTSLHHRHRDPRGHSHRLPTGAPFVNSEGRVVAIDLGHIAVPVNALYGPCEGADESAPSRWRLRMGLDLQLRWIPDTRVRAGFQYAIGLLGFDRFGIEARAGLSANSEENVEGVTDEFGTVLDFSLEVQLHIPLRVFHSPARFVLSGGATLMHDIRTRTTPTLSIPDGCDPSAEICEVRIDSVEEEIDNTWYVRPYARLQYELGTTALAYQFTLDLDDASNSTHTFSIGLRY